MINRQNKRLTSIMDSDLNVPLLNYAGINYLRTEIARLEKLVVEKTTRVQPSASSQAVAERRSILCILQWVLLTRRMLQPHRWPSSDKRRSSSVKERREHHKPTCLNGTIVRTFGYHATGDTEFKSGPEERRTASRMR